MACTAPEVRGTAVSNAEPYAVDFLMGSGQQAQEHIDKKVALKYDRAVRPGRLMRRA